MGFDVFKLHIRLGNEAMQSRDVADALRKLADRLDRDGRDSGKIMDANGNSVGAWEFCDEV